MSITITVDDREVRAALEHLAWAAGNLSPALRDISELLAERTKEHFA